MATATEVVDRSVLVYEAAGAVFIIVLGSVLHFTFEISGGNPLVGAFSAVNESVWEHLKLVFWPAVLFMLIEYIFVKNKTANFALAKTAGVYLAVIIIPVVFYSYTAITRESILLIDISTFVVAVVIGQILSYKLLRHEKLSESLDKTSLALLIILGIAFMLFTFYPPSLHPFQDPVTGKYGIPQ